MKTILVIVVLILVLTGALGALTVGVLQHKEAAAETALKVAVWWFLGSWPEVGNFKLDLEGHRIVVQDLKIREPEGFPPEDKWLLQVPEISVTYDPASFAQRKLLLKELTVAVKELTIVRDENTRVNVDTLKFIQELKRNALTRSAAAQPSASVKTSADKPVNKYGKGQAEAPVSKEKDKVPFRIDRLHLELRWVVYKDYTQGKVPFVQENRADFNETFYNVTNAERLRHDIFAKTIAGRAVNAFAQYQLGLFSPVSPTLFSPQAKAASQTIEDLVQTLLPFDTN